MNFCSCHFGSDAFVGHGNQSSMKCVGIESSFDSITKGTPLESVAPSFSEFSTPHTALNPLQSLKMRSHRYRTLHQKYRRSLSHLASCLHMLLADSTSIRSLFFMLFLKCNRQPPEEQLSEGHYEAVFLTQSLVIDHW